MKKIFLSMILTLGLTVSLIGCGKNDVIDATIAEQTETVKNNEDTDIAENEDTVEVSEVKTVVSENKEEYQYEEQKDIFVVKDIDIGDGIQIDMSNEELDKQKYVLPESIDIYSYFGTYAGYTKPDIKIGSIGRFDGWVSICFAKSSFLAKEEDFDKVAVVEESEKSKQEQTVPMETDTQISTSAKDVSSIDTVTASATNSTAESVVENPTPTESSKYTPEEAISVYRSLMEAGGMTWDPSLKGVTSWGTGWIYLDKGQPEWCASTDLESAAIGGHGGNSWTKYYLEVTGSDENAVYITEWTSN